MYNTIIIFFRTVESIISSVNFDIPDEPASHVDLTDDPPPIEEELRKMGIHHSPTSCNDKMSDFDYISRQSTGEKERYF